MNKLTTQEKDIKNKQTNKDNGIFCFKKTFNSIEKCYSGQLLSITKKSFSQGLLAFLNGQL